jgi:hypothetical protein
MKVLVWVQLLRANSAPVVPDSIQLGANALDTVFKLSLDLVLRQTPATQREQ